MPRNKVQSNGESLSTNDVLKKPLEPLVVPMRTLNGHVEVIVLGFRQNMLEMGDCGGVDTGTGMGSDFILLRWGERQTLIRGSELLKAWVATFSPEDAARFPEEVRSL